MQQYSAKETGGEWRNRSTAPPLQDALYLLIEFRNVKWGLVIIIHGLHVCPSVQQQLRGFHSTIPWNARKTLSALTSATRAGWLSAGQILRIHDMQPAQNQQAAHADWERMVCRGANATVEMHKDQSSHDELSGVFCPCRNFARHIFSIIIHPACVESRCNIYE